MALTDKYVYKLELELYASRPLSSPDTLLASQSTLLADTASKQVFIILASSGANFAPIW